MEAICPLCQQEVETVDHLFCGCNLSWSFWVDCLSWWEVAWCCPRNVMDFYQAWNGVNLLGLEKKFWKTLFFSVVWSLWNIRNRVVFEHASPYCNLKRRQVKHRWGYWIKSWLGDRKLGGDEVIAARPVHPALRFFSQIRSLGCTVRIDG